MTVASNTESEWICFKYKKLILIPKRFLTVLQSFDKCIQIKKTLYVGDTIIK